MVNGKRCQRGAPEGEGWGFAWPGVGGVGFGNGKVLARGKGMSLIDSRVHPILMARGSKLRLNRLAVLGGEAYVRARLWRAPNESRLSWEGRTVLPAYGAWDTGRRDRAVCHREAGRIADKINQYLFAKPPARDGADEEFVADAGVHGETLAEIWQEVSTAVTACGWCWLAVVAPQTPEGISLAQARGLGLRPRLTVLWPWEVPDWRFRADGTLHWAITEAFVREDSDPMRDAEDLRLRTLWRAEPGAAVSFAVFRDGVQVRAGELPAGAPVPLLCIGKPSADPWWFDEAESVQAQLMNLDSLHMENLARTVYPQLIISAGTFDNLESHLVEQETSDSGRKVVELVKELTRSVDAPIVESAEESGITRYIQPNASDLKAIPDAIKDGRSALFESVGLALFNREQRQIQTAESKAFDHLDTAATLRQRANLLEDAERKTIALLQAADPSFRAYEPVWNKDFDVPDATGDANALLQVGNLPNLTLTQRKVLLRAATSVLDAVAPISQEDRRAIDAEIDALTDDTGEPQL